MHTSNANLHLVSALVPPLYYVATKVGLRWWSNVKEDGSTEWVFESLEDMSEISSADYKLFWIGLYATPVLWIGLLITGIMLLKFQVRSGPGAR